MPDDAEPVKYRQPAYDAVSKWWRAHNPGTIEPGHLRRAVDVGLSAMGVPGGYAVDPDMVIDGMDLGEALRAGRAAWTNTPCPACHRVERCRCSVWGGRDRIAAVVVAVAQVLADRHAGLPPVEYVADLAGDGGLVVRDGETLIVRVSRDSTMQEADEIRQGLAGRLPGVDVVVVAADQLAVHQPDRIAEVPRGLVAANAAFDADMAAGLDLEDAFDKVTCRQTRWIGGLMPVNGPSCRVEVPDGLCTRLLDAGGWCFVHGYQGPQLPAEGRVEVLVATVAAVIRLHAAQQPPAPTSGEGGQS